MDYLNFDLWLGEWNPAARTGIAEVWQSPAGEGERHHFTLDVEPATCAERVQRTAAMAAELGQKLAAGAFSAENMALWRESYQIARERNRGLRLRLHIDSWELAQLPWELLYDSRQAEFLVFDPRVSLVRYLRLHSMPPALRQSRALQVLAVVASPIDLPRLNWEHELAVLNDALGELAQAGQVQVLQCLHATQESLHLTLLERTPDVVHWIGHGAYERQERQGLLFLEDEAQRSTPMRAGEAARLLRRYGVNLVVLNACETGKGAWASLASALVRAEIPAVVAMQWPVEDRAAIRFSRLFYKALSLGMTIDECVAEGRLGASATSADPNDWAAPVLFLRSASGRLWTTEPAALAERQPSTAAPAKEAPRGDAAPQVPRSLAREFYFKTRGPLLAANEPELIIDRPELRRALRLAQQPSVTQYIAILSARQTGKTTLLFRLKDLLQDFCACVFIDLSVLRAQDANACFRFVAFRLLSEFRALLGHDPLPPERRPLESPVDFIEFLRELATAAPMPRIVLLLDEVGALLPEVSDSFFNTLRTVFNLGRGLDNQLAKYLFVFSGAVDLQALTSGANSPLNICEKLYLSDFELADVYKIVSQFAKLGVTVAPGTAEAVHTLTGGHPYLTMRLCTLLEGAQVPEVNPAKVEAMAEQMLVEDDNIRHVLAELDRRPLERRRLRSILLEGRAVHFSRNDSVLASLEMIGVVRPTQPCAIRNRLYERALRQYFAQLEERAGQLAAGAASDEGLETTYSRLLALRAEALDAEGVYRPGVAWETFIAALFSLVPAFSPYPGLHTDPAHADVVLAINGAAPGGSHWNIYQPAILVLCRDLRQAEPEAVVSEMMAKAALHNIKLIFLISSSGALPPARRALFSGARGETSIVVLDDAEILRLLEERQDLETLLRNRVLEARLRKI